MKLKNQPYPVPYSMCIETGTGLYKSLESTAQKVLTKSKEELSSIILNKLRTKEPSIDEEKIIAFEALLIGVLWLSHAEKANATRDSSISELEHLISVAKSSSSTDVLKNAYYSFRNHQLTIENSSKVYPLELSLEAFNKLIRWLRATEEYEFELKVFENWYQYWERKGESKFLFDMNVILRNALRFEEICNSELGRIFNHTYFENEIRNISKAREDYFQVTKSVPEFYLNGIGAVWMNELNKKAFNTNDKKLVIAPGCMRPDNGNSCTAIMEGTYLRCNNCNSKCNVYSLVQEGKVNGFDVLIALHKSTFKVEKSQLNNKGVVGIACMPCLISGGLMLLEKGIHAQCAILTQPGCKKHWTKNGEMTRINLEELKVVIETQEPSTCK